MNNVQQVLAPTTVSTASTLHPSTAAGRLSSELCGAATPSKHVTKASILKTLYKRQTAAPH